jgi:hypothetical protein
MDYQALTYYYYYNTVGPCHQMTNQEKGPYAPQSGRNKPTWVIYFYDKVYGGRID